MKKADTKKAAPAKALVKKTATAKAPVKKQTAKKKMAIGGFATDFAQGQAFTGNPDLVPTPPQVQQSSQLNQQNFMAKLPTGSQAMAQAMQKRNDREFLRKLRETDPQKAAMARQQLRSAPPVTYGTASGLSALPPGYSVPAPSIPMAPMAKGGAVKKKMAKGGAVKKSTKGKK